MKITIIYLEEDMLISKERFEDWRQVQEDYESYKTSLGPWNVEQVIEYLHDEYPNLAPNVEVQVGNLLKNHQKTLKLTFNE